MKIKSLFRTAGFSALLSLMIHPSWAITSYQLPGSTLPEQVDKSFTAAPVHPAAQATLPAAPVAEKSVLGEKAKKIKFKLNGLILEGNVIYKTSELLPIYKNKLHTTISISDLFLIVENITSYYRNNGYVLTRAILPPQHVKKGVVHVRIVEGFIDKVNVMGNPGGARPIVQEYGNQIAKHRPFRLANVERNLMILNEIPHTQVKAVLGKSKKTQGAADLNLITENHPINGFLSYDNYGTRYIGPQQMTANFGLNSWFTAGDSTQLAVVKTPKGNEMTYGDINYNVPLYANGLRWLLGGTRVHTHPLFVLEPSNIDGINYNYYTSLQYPLLRSRDQNLTLQAGLNYQDSKVNSFGEQLYNDHLRSLDLGAIYNFSDHWYGFNYAALDLRKGLPIFGYTSDTNPNTALTSRPGGRGDYTKFTLQLSRLQSIKGPFSLFGIVRGQWAFNPLLASEQFAFGGSQLGRGYDVAEIIGDKGLAGSIELRYDLNIGQFLLQNMQFYTFYDAGKIWNYSEISGIPTKQSATSAGFGTRFYFTKYISGNFMWAQPLTKAVAAEQFINRGKNPRVFFSVIATL